MKTEFLTKDRVERKWYVIDADGLVLGRMATKIASMLRGKHKPVFTPNADTGDFIVVVNAEKVRLTGRKMDQKAYYSHSGYPGGIKESSIKRTLNEHPARVVEAAVKGMLPKNRLGRQLYSKLKVYSGPDHPHEAQQPETLDLKETING